MKRLSLWIAAVFVLALLAAIGVSAVAGEPAAESPRLENARQGITQADSIQPEMLACDVAVTKGRLGTGAVQPGTNLTYKVDITNQGASTASSVRVTDTLPISVDYWTCARTSGGCAGLIGAGPGGEDLVIWELADLVPGQSETLWITVWIHQSTVTPWLINWVEARSGTADSNSANNTATLMVQVTFPATPTNTSPPITLPTPTPTATAKAPRQVYLPILMKQFVGGTASTLIFSDDFNDGLLTGWTRNGGGWYNENNYMRGIYSGGPSGAAWNIKSISGSNFTYEGDVNILSGFAAGLTFRSSSDGRYSYEASLVTSGSFRIAKRPGYAVLASYPWSVSNNRWYHIKVVVTGTKIEGYLDGVKRLTAYDTNFSSGQFGVMLATGSGAYDNLEAWTLP